VATAFTRSGRPGVHIVLAAIARQLCVAIACFLLLGPALAKDVVVIYSNHRLIPANVEVERGLREALESSSSGDVELFAEFLDRPTFSGPAFEKVFASYMHDKYAMRPPDLIAVVGYPALDFLLRNRSHLFAAVPVVHVGIEEGFLKSVDSLPSNVIGVPVSYDFAGTIELALRLHPGTRKLVVVTGTSSSDRVWEAQIRSDVSRLRIAPTVEYVAGLPHAEVMQRLGELGDHTVVFTPGYLRDGAGQLFVPRDAAAQMAAVSAAPIYGPFSSFIGAGVVGGRMPAYVEMGRQAGRTVTSLLEGTAPEALHLPAQSPLGVQLDWHQVLRWQIDPGLVPAPAVLHFKRPTFWEEYRTRVIVIVTVLAMQAALIVALLVERRSRRRTESALVESERSMSLATSAAGLSLWAWDPARDRFWMRARACQRDDVVHQDPVTFRQALDAVHPEDRDRFDRAIRRAAAAGHELDIEYRMVRPDGDVRWLAARGRATAHGSDERLTGVALDITARKLAELQAAKDRIALTHMTRVSTLGQLSASIAHQLNQPLTAILGNAEVASRMLSKRRPDLAELREICDDIVKDDHRASEVIRRLSALYRRGEMKFAPLDLNELVTETLELVRTELMTRHVMAVTELAALPFVDGERIQLQQVLLNLILNAADAMSSIDAARRRLVVRTQLQGARVCVDVIDNGVGIAPASLGAVFDAFWSTKEGGTGVGLTICRSIVSAHRGTLTVHNNPDGGARFCASWPLQHGDRPAAHQDSGTVSDALLRQDAHVQRQAQELDRSDERAGGLVCH
jgi:signal transduction histidine kinase